MITCTFAGHREVYKQGISEALDNVLSEILSNPENEFRFLVGGMGEYDALCATAIRKAKRNFPDKLIKLILVLPYFKQELNVHRSYYEIYDDIYIPMELAEVHPKFAITKRNRIMIDESQYLIAYVYRNFGGAYGTLKYAQKQGLKIINLALLWLYVY